MRRRALAPQTRRLYLSRIRRFLTEFGRPPRALAPREVRAYVDELAADPGRGRGSVLQTLTALRFLYRETVPRPEVMVALRARPRIVPLGPPVLSRDEALRLWRAAPTDRDRVLVGLLYGSGLRLGEALAVAVGDVDRAGLRIRAAARPRPRRWVPLSPRLDPHLARLIAGRSLWARLLQSGLGRPLSSRAAQNALERAGTRAGLGRRVTPSLLRRSFAAHLLDRGAAPCAVQLWLGQSEREGGGFDEGGRGGGGGPSPL